ncbi:hypothetical protein C8Q74DRAFT_1367009 [Fomes fomentarius]|nr:hypothetical protein C8Q74DRAFT_1367009 [Fomes fomentarius]
MLPSVAYSGVRDGAFVRFSGHDVPTHDVVYLPELEGKVDELKDAALNHVGHLVYAFNTLGWFKAWSVLDYSQFKPNPNCDLYVRVEYPGWQFFQNQDSSEGEVIERITDVSTATALERAVTVRYGDNLELIPAAFTTAGVVRSRVKYPLVRGPGANPASLDGIYIRTDFPGYTYYPSVDSNMNDIRRQTESMNNVPTLVVSCNQEALGAGFNTNAFIKKKIVFPLTSVPSFSTPTQGTYARHGWPDFVFLPGLDSPGGDLHRPTTTDVVALVTEARQNPDIVAFNTHGWQKKTVQTEPREWPVKERFNPLHGVYVKIHPHSTVSARAGLDNALFALKGTALIWSEWFLTDAGVRTNYTQAVTKAADAIVADVTSGTRTAAEGAEAAHAIRKNYLIITRRKRTPITAGPNIVQTIKSAGGSYQSYLEQSAMQQFSQGFANLTPSQASVVSVNTLESTSRANTSVIGVLRRVDEVSRAVLAIGVGMSVYSVTVAEAWKEKLTRQVRSWARSIVNGMPGVGVAETSGGPAGAVLAGIIGNALRGIGEKGLASWFFGGSSSRGAVDLFHCKLDRVRRAVRERYAQSGTHTHYLRMRHVACLVGDWDEDAAVEDMLRDGPMGASGTDRGQGCSVDSKVTLAPRE